MTFLVTSAGDGIVKGKIGNHTVLADTPVMYGGNDRAPSPGDHFLFGLAACACMTLQLWLDKKGVNEEVAVHLDYRKEGGTMRDFRFVVTVPGLPIELHDDAIRVIGQCPVKRALHEHGTVVVDLKT